MTAASLDFGSNTVGYLIGRTRGGRFEEIERAAEFMRLAEGVRSSGRLSDAAIERTLRWVEQIAARLRAREVTRVRAVGTEALRLAANADALRTPVRELLGAELEIIAGEAEARFTFDGVRLGYPGGPLGVLDIGGGSVELTLAGHATDPLCASLPLGAVVLTEACGEDWSALRQRLDATASPLPPVPEGLTELMVVGGTGANVALMDQGLTVLRDESVEGHRVDVERVRELRDQLRARPVAERVERLGIPPRRADIIVAAMAVLEWTLERLGIGVVRASRYSLRHGVLRPLLEGAP